MELPKYHETFNPILDVLSNGEMIHYSELQKRVRDKYYLDLPKELLNQKTTTGANILLDRIGWGKSYLKQGKFVDYPKRAMVQITGKGKDIIGKGGITLHELKKDKDFLEYRKDSQLKSEQKRDNKSDDISIIENSSPQDLIDSGFSAIEGQVKSELLEKLKTIDPYYFEKVILILLKKMGYGDFIETSKSGDEGIDGMINEDILGLDVIYIQAKRRQGQVSRPELQKFVGALAGKKAKKGVFVTTSQFSSDAKNYAHQMDMKVILIDGDKLVDLMHTYGVGVQVKSTYEVKEIDEDFFENS